MTTDSHPAPADTSSWFNVPGWAAYLACSWTWCIGMFLPVLLVRDYGVWGWIVFAVPNVLGAAAMGWVLRSAEVSPMRPCERRGWRTMCKLARPTSPKCGRRLTLV